MKEKVFEAFKALGFKLDKIANLCYSFCYEGKHCLFSLNKDDEEFMSVAIPVFRVEEDMDPQAIAGIHHIMDDANSESKYVKVNLFWSGVWVFYERAVLGDEDFEKTLQHMICHIDRTEYLVSMQIEALLEELKKDSDLDEVNHDESIMNDDME